MNFYSKVVVLAFCLYTCFSVSGQTPSYKAGFAHKDSAEYILAKNSFRKAIDEYADLGKLDSAAAAGYYTHRILFTLRDFVWDSLYVADTLADLMEPLGKVGQAVLTQCKGEASFFSFDLEYCAEQLDEAYPLLQESTPIDQFLVENRQMRAFVYADYGKLDQALKTMQEAVSDAEVRFGLEGKTTGFTYRNLGLIHSYRDELPESAEAYRKSLEILQTRLLPNNPNIPTQYINLASLYMQQSRHDLALETFTKAFQHDFLKTNKNIDRIYHPYSNWLSQMGLNNEALVWAIRADSSCQSKYGENGNGRIDVLLNLGNVQLALKHEEDALASYEKALDICENTNSSPLLMVSSLEGIGRVKFASGQQKEAKSYFDKASIFLARTDQAPSSQLNQLKVYQAMNELALGNVQAAKALVSEALLQIEEDDLLHTRLAVDASVVAAKVDFALGDEKSALTQIRRSIKAIKSFQSLGVTQHYAVDFAAPLNFIEGAKKRTDLNSDWLQLADILKSALQSQQYDWIGSLDQESLHAFQHTFRRAGYAAKDGCSSGNDANCELALAYADLPRAITLRQRANRATAGARLILPDSLLTQLRSLERERLALDHSQYNENRRTEMLDSWNERNADFKDEMRRAFPGFYASNVDPLILDVSAFRQNQMSGDQLYISFTLDTLGGRILRCAIRGEDLRIDELPFGKTEQQNITTFLGLLASRSQDGLGLSASSLYNSLFEGLPETYLTSSKYGIAADGILQSIPWTALLSKLPTSDEPMSQWEWLAKTHDVVVADAVGSFANQQSDLIHRQVTAIAPGFDSDYQQRISSIGAVQTNSPALIRTPWTLTTLDWLKEQFSAVTSVGLDANEKTVMQLAQSTGILHLGTHAFYDEDDPLQSYFALTPVSAESSNDGQLHAYELYAARINAELAVLPACNSGSGEYDSSNGTLSLATAIRAAGCPTVVQSLWSIDDQQTNDLLKVFYEQLNLGNPTDKALANAQRMHLASAGVDYQHPYYWAGLTVVGSSVAMATADTNKWILWGLGLLFLVGAFTFFRGKRKVVQS